MTQVKEKSEYKYLQTVSFSTWFNWDVKSYATNNLKSKYDFVKLGLVLNEQTEKVKLKDFPNQEFGILGVNNKTGVFDAYLEKGSKINQPYKIMKTNWIAYNPYRVNVGSVGIKTENQKYEYISNAYIVFSCLKEKLDTDFFFRLFKTNTFNNLVKKSTKGSVRQNLSFDLLSNIQIPLPSIPIQKSLVAKYDKELAEVKKLGNKVNDLNKKIEDYLLEELGIIIEEKTKKKGLNFINFRDLDRWGVDFGLFTSTLKNLYQNTKFPIENLGSHIEYLQYGLSEKADEISSGIPMLRMNNLQNSELDFTDLKYIKKCSDNYLLCKDDLLFNRTNSKELVGKTAVFELEKKMAFASYLIRVRFNKENTNVHYVNFLMNSRIGRTQINMISRQVLGQANINSQELKEFLFPFPSIDKQNKIVQKILSFREEISDTKKKIEALKEEAKKDFETSLFDLL